MVSTINIKKIGELYSASVTPPDSEVTWDSPHAMTAKELFDALLKLGCNGIDILDAFYMADPNLTHL